MNTIETKNKVIIHGHAHQPHRRWWDTRKPHSLYAAPMRESSSRFHNWTEEIYNECYNALKGAYKHLSFNFTSSLLLQLPKEFIENLTQSDSGNAIATGFDHTILPLAVKTDKATQIAWGLRHFEQIFGRKSEGFWLPELAVNLETLSMLNSFGIKYVILSPFSVKEIDRGSGMEALKFDNGTPIIDFGRPYKIKTSDGSFINAFLYNPHLATPFAFKELLNEGCGFQIANKFTEQLQYYPIAGVATDIETFGHHKKSGAKNLLAYLFDWSVKRGHSLTNFGNVLRSFNKDEIREIKIYSPSSWSCSHGIGRWERNCGCEGENAWREGYRATLDLLSIRTDKIYLEQTKGILNDPGGARLRYIEVLLGNKTFEEFIEEEKISEIALSQPENISRVFNALVPRQAMYVSCAWFFGGMGHETKISMAAAYHLMNILKPLDPEIENEFINDLKAVQNDQQGRSAVNIFKATKKSQDNHEEIIT